MSSSAPTEGRLSRCHESYPPRLPGARTTKALRGLWRFATRPVRTQTWRDTAYLLLGGITSDVAFGVLLAGGIGGGVLAITLLGLPVFVLMLLVARGVAWLERRRAWLVFGSTIASHYRRGEKDGWSKVKAILGDAQTSKDQLWLLVLVPIGFSFALAVAVAWGVVLGSLLLPVFRWAIPESERLDYGFVMVDSWESAALVACIAAGAAILLSWLVRGLALAEGLIARALLARSPSAALAERVSELEESRAAAVGAQAAELRRIERDLHDGAQARLVAVALDLGLAREKFDTRPDEAKELVASAHGAAKMALRDLRDLVRGIHPAILADRGLGAALPALAASCRVPVNLHVDLDRRPPEAAETAAYFVVAEALANVSKHSDATACTVVVERRSSRLIVEVADDGRGVPSLATGAV